MELDDNLKQLMRELGSAINDSLSESEPIAQAISNIKGAGYDVFLVLEATIGFNKHDEEEDPDHLADDSAAKSEPHHIRTETLELTNQDAKFLRSLKISLDEDGRAV